ncbi:MAG: ATP-dependent Clp protease proteolytic subunit [Bacteroidales bacterium]|jgi:ATP-dependent protease ClpP protease subunit
MQRFDIAGVIKDPDPFYEIYFGEPEKGCTGITALKKFLSETPDNEIEVVINSPGGDAQMGLDMHDALVMSGKDITTRVAGICYSAATPSLLAAKKEKRSMSENSSIGIHLPYIPPYTLADSYTADELQSLADGMRVFENLYIKLYADTTAKTEEDLRALMVKETIMNADLAIELSFVSSMVKTNVVDFKQLKAVAFINPKSYTMEPKEIQEKTSLWEKVIQKIDAFLIKAETPPLAEPPAVEPDAKEQLDAVTAENETLKTKIAELEAAKLEAEAKLTEANSIKAEFETLKTEVEGFKSNFKPPDRVQQEKHEAKSFEQIKAEAIQRSRERDLANKK